MPETYLLKQVLRKELSAKRRLLSPLEYQQKSSQIMLYLDELLTSLEPKQLLFYRALPVEVNTDVLLEQNHFESYVPRMLNDADMEWVRVNSQTTWKQVEFGVFEPKQGEIWQASDAKTVLICPLLGFDRQGQRLGMGKGYFDRWLDKQGKHISTRIGLAFSCQELSKVPTQPHDVPLSTIITEGGIISCPTL